MATARTAGGETAKNKQVIQEFFKTVVNQRNVDALRNFVAADGTCGGKAFREMVVDPDPTRVRALGRERLVPATVPGATARGAAGNVNTFADFTRHVLDAFPDMKVQIQSMIAEGDKVVVHWTSSGTHKGEFLGTPATGRTVPMNSVDTFTLKDGKIVGVQAHPDSAGVLHALGHLPETPVAAALGLGRRAQG